MRQSGLLCAPCCAVLGWSLKRRLFSLLALFVLWLNLNTRLITRVDRKEPDRMPVRVNVFGIVYPGSGMHKAFSSYVDVLKQVARVSLVGCLQGCRGRWAGREYESMYPDVKGTDPVEHFRRRGKKEGRCWPGDDVVHPVVCQKADINVFQFSWNWPGVEVLDNLLKTARFNVLIVFFETKDVPPGLMRDALLEKKFDMIWAPNDFLGQIVSEIVGKAAVAIVPPPLSLPVRTLDVAARRRQGLRNFFGVNDNTVVFLYIFAGDSLGRKNPFLLRDAFVEEFGSEDDVFLVLKTMTFNADDRREMAKMGNRDRILIIDALLGTKRLKNFYQGADVYVATERGCGHGLPQIDAMAEGLLLISSPIGMAYSLQNMTHFFGVDVMETRISRDKIYTSSGVWFEPSKESLKRLLRLAYQNPSLRKRVANTGREWLKQAYGKIAVAKEIKKSFSRLLQTSAVANSQVRSFEKLRWTQVNLFTPLPPMQSGISLSVGAVVSELLTLLKNRASLAIWVQQGQPVESFQGCRVVRYVASTLDDASLTQLLSPSVLNVFNLGNNPDFHFQIASVMSVVPGVVALHDGVLVGLWHGVNSDAFYEKQDERMVIEALAGASTCENRKMRCTQMERLFEDAVRYPMTAFRAYGSLGFVVHSHLAKMMLEYGMREPLRNVVQLPMPYVNQKRRMMRIIPTKGQVMEILVLGGVTFNRGHSILVSAFMSNTDLCTGLRVNFVGNVVVEKAPISCFFYHGRLPDNVLEGFLANASLAINIRAPSFGECSYSLVQLLEAGIPVITSSGLLECIGGRAPRTWRVLDAAGDTKKSAKLVQGWVRGFKTLVSLDMIDDMIDDTREIFRDLYPQGSLKYADGILEAGRRGWEKDAAPMLTMLVVVSETSFSGVGSVVSKFFPLGGGPEWRVQVVVIVCDSSHGTVGRLEMIEGNVKPQIGLIRLREMPDGRALLAASRAVTHLGRFVLLMQDSAFPRSFGWLVRVLRRMLDVKTSMVCPVFSKKQQSCDESAALIRGQDFARFRERIQGSLVVSTLATFIKADGLKVDVCSRCLFSKTLTPLGVVTHNHTTLQRPLIPLVLYQTEKEPRERLPKKVLEAMAQFQRLNPAFRVAYFDDVAASALLVKSYGKHSSVVDAFERLLVPAFKMDFWRYCILYKFGGFYLDADALVLKPLPLSMWATSSFVAPTELVPFGVNNAFFGSKAGHPILGKAMELVIANVKKGLYPPVPPVLRPYLPEHPYMAVLTISTSVVLGRAFNEFVGTPELQAHNWARAKDLNITILRHCIPEGYKSLSVLTEKGKSTLILLMGPGASEKCSDGLIQFKYSGHVVPSEWYGKAFLEKRVYKNL
jgi:glycosyltransferase involved in cell wall biosynthesis